MDFNELTQKFTSKVKQLGKDTAEEVQKLNKIRQLNGKANDAKKQIENIYSEIGKKFYELHKDSVPEGFEEFVQTISDKLVEIEQLKEQVREVKGVVLCPSCNTEVSADERFCPNCGGKMPEPVEEADAEDESAVVVDAEDVTENAKEAAEDIAGDVKDMAKEAAADLKEAAAETAEDAKEAVADTAEELVDGAKEKAEELADGAKEKAEELADGAKEIAGNAADELREAAEDLKEDAEKLF